MIRERGMFSNRYLTRKGKENLQAGNTEEIDFPLAYTSNKYHSKERTPISIRPKKETKVQDKQPAKSQHVLKLQKELKDSKQQIKKLRADLQFRQVKHDHAITDLAQQTQQKSIRIDELICNLRKSEKRVKQLESSTRRYKETIKEQIYWLLKFFVNANSGEWDIEELKHQIENNYRGFHQYIEQLGIQKELQELASTSSIGEYQPNNLTHITNMDSIFNQPAAVHPVNADSIFTQQMEDNHVVKLMQLQPLIETFNNNQYQAVDSKIAKKLFSQDSDSPLFKQRALRIKTNISLNENSVDDSLSQLQNKDIENEFLSMSVEKINLPRDVKIVKDFNPASEEENYICLKKGQTLKLLRRVRNGLWIGQHGERIGLVLQEYFQG